jgi:hypothetical protein
MAHTRCDNGWMWHPTNEWAISCPSCQDESEPRYWLPSQVGKGRIARRHELPHDHPSQAVVPRPWYVEEALDDLRAALRSRTQAVQS